MPYNQKILSKKQMLCSQNLPKENTELSGRDFQNMLQLLNCSDDLNLLVKIFSTLGLMTLSKKNTTHEQIIKCEALYRKLVLVLKSGLQTKTIIALNLISAILYLEDERGITKNKTLHFYAKNMIRISGCLTTLNDLFTNFMMHQDTWKALCRSIRDACDACTTNQSHCSHIVPLCIKRCQGSLAPILLLQSLLSNHQRNIQLFHDCNGMTIFTRESIQHPECLLLLNTIVENTKPENQSEILKASYLFRELQYHINKYGLESSIGKWASIVLFSHRKAFGRGEDEEEENKNILNNVTITISPYSTHNNKSDNYSFNETTELFRNVLNEVADWKNQYGNKSLKSIYKNGNYNDTICNRHFEQPAYGGWHPTGKKIFQDTTEYEKSDRFSYPFTYNSNHDRSLSFLLTHNEKVQRISDAKNTTVNAVRSEVNSNNNNYKGTERSIRHVLKRSMKDKQKKTFEEFKPRFVSTPKSRNTNVKEKNKFQTVRNSFRSSTSDHVIGDKSMKGRTKFINTMQTCKKLRNTSLSSKLFDIVNESCTTLIKGFKNIFKSKQSINLSKESVTTFVKQDNSCSNTFTNHIKQKVTGGHAQVDNEEERTNFSKEFSMELSNFGSCNTCNDTITIRDKLARDVTLQRTIKKLKLGINLYGCDFKKISRTMWPHKAYMTPNVIYNLYRKLILKQ